MSYIGDFALESTFDTKFTTVTTTGAPTTLAGSPVISAYVGNSLTQITAGITLTVDFDGVTGMNHVRVVATAANGFATASNYQLVITVGTVGGTSVVGYVVAEFSIEARSSLRPTVADRTLDVTATGAAGIDWGNVENPTTAQNLSATNIDVDQIVASVSGAVGSVTGLTNATIADAVLDEDMTAHQTQGSLGQTIGDPVADTNTIYKAVVTDATGATVGVDVVAVKAETVSIQADADNIQTRLPAALVGGRMDSSVGAMAAGVIAAATFAANALDAVWSTATRLLTAGTNIVLAKGVGVTGFNDLSAAQVNAEVVDGLNVDTYAEPAAVPAATVSIATKLGWLFTLARNKITQTSTTQTLRNDADAANVATSTVSDDGVTLIRGEWV